jgi:hypothetical protein
MTPTITPEQLMALLRPKVTPEQAEELLLKVAQRATTLLEAVQAGVDLEAACKSKIDDNGIFHLFLNTKIQGLVAAIAQKREELRLELHALRDQFSLDNVRPLAEMESQVSYLTGEMQHLVEVQMGADEVAFYDAADSLAALQYELALSLAKGSYLQTVRTLGPALEAEGGELGIIGGKTSVLSEAAAVALDRAQRATATAREVRRAYDERMAARARNMR